MCTWEYIFYELVITNATNIKEDRDRDKVQSEGGGQKLGEK